MSSPVARRTRASVCSVIASDARSTIRRMGVSRTYHSELNDLPEVDLPDWGLLAELWELFVENAPGSAALDIRGTDRRGTFTSNDFESFRGEAERRGEPLTRVVLDSLSREPGGGSRRMRIQAGGLAKHGRYSVAEVSSGDEVFTKGLASRITDLFAAAANRRQERLQAAKHSDGGAEPPATRGPLGRILGSNWTITIVGGAIATLIVVVVVALVT
jgi:hypothetical protein